LAFKANTDDVRDSPALAVIHRLIDAGAQIVGHDPAATVASFGGFRQVSSALDAVRESDALVILTEWPEYAAADPSATLRLMRSPQIVDARRILDPTTWLAAGAKLTVLGGIG
jgi:UDPglucose 6-dehydrogenase